MKINFRIEIAKLFLLVSVGLVLIIGFLSRLSFETLLIRVLIGGGVFTVVGYFLGAVIQQQEEFVLVKEEKQKMKAKVIENIQYVNSKQKTSVDDFAPMDVENLTKIIVDSLED